MSKLFLSNPTAVAGVLTGHQGNVSMLCAPIIFVMLLFAGNYCKAQSSVQLAPPLMKYYSVFFKDASIVELKFAQPGTQIHYTLNNQQPTEQDQVYSKPIRVKKSFTTVKAMAAGEGFLNSETVSATFIKDGIKIKSVQQTTANVKFPGSGINTLIDNEGGITDLNSKTWLGYQLDSVEINVEMVEMQNLSSVLINCLQDHGSWVFLPEQFRVYSFDNNKQSFQLIAEQIDSSKQIIASASCRPLTIQLAEKIITQKLKIVLQGIKSLPEGHPGKGQHGWLFIDEIKLY